MRKRKNTQRTAADIYNYHVVVETPLTPENKAILLTNAEYCYKYAKNILRGRFNVGEEVIYSDPVRKNAYRAFMNELEAE